MKNSYFLLLLFLAQFSVAQTWDLNFESSSSCLWIDSAAADSLWQIGVPNKPILDSAYSVPNAIMTDTINPYPTNSNASFLIEFELGGATPYIEFYHKFDTDSLHAGGFVELSFDGGNDWILIYNNSVGYTPGQDTLFQDSQDFLYYMYDVYFSGQWPGANDTLFNGAPGFQGQSNGWIYSRIDFACTAVKSLGQFLLRFTFLSDSTSSTKDGWLIDNIYINNMGVCSSIEENHQLLSSIYPNPVNQEINLELSKSIDHFQVEIYNVIGQQYFSNTYYNTEYLTISPDLPIGSYFIVLKKENQVIGRKQFVKI